jgi:4-hydroxy 2-oxovalerate aldolase
MLKTKKEILLDCTLRDGGYYNAWDFSPELINDYLFAMQAVGVNAVELGFRSLNNKGFKGACAFTSDDFLRSLPLPKSLIIGVMVNANELVADTSQEKVLEKLFPVPASDSPVDLVRIASHIHEFEKALPAVTWLEKQGYQVGFNLMQIADCPEKEVKTLARLANNYPLEALYFADSMGSMSPQKTAQIIGWLRSEWHGALGIHTHNNLGLALSNTLRALDEGVTWVDATVTGMGRGPGNALTEELAIEVADRRGQKINLVPLMTLIRKNFRPMKEAYGWGTNPYYYLAGKYGIHPTYIQEMLNDSRYSEEDVLAVIEHLRVEGGRKFSLNTLDAARHFYRGVPQGKWSPKSIFARRDVLILGAGQGVEQHRTALESFIRNAKPLVLALNTQNAIAPELIDLRVACHPVRLLADCEAHTKLPQPLITPYSMLPQDVQQALADKEVLDFGLNVQADTFELSDTYCTIPTSLVVAYALAVISCGKADKVYMAGFDGYGADDPRSKEMQNLLDVYSKLQRKPPLYSITPTRYNLASKSVYASLSDPI